MTLRAQVKFDAGDVRQKIAGLLRRLRAIQRGTTADPTKLRNLVDEYVTLIERLGLPTFTGGQLDARETATFQRLQRLFDDIMEDVDSLFASHRGLASMIVRSYNRATAILLGSEAELRNAAAESLTAAIQGGIPQRGVFIAIETFEDTAHVDSDKTNAEIATAGGALILQRTEVFPVDQSLTKVTLAADNSKPMKRDVSGSHGITKFPQSGGGGFRSSSRATDAPIFNQPYEAKFYDLLGQAEFEGGRLKLIDNKKGGLMPATVEEFRLEKARRVMIDGTPDTYHQVERVILGQEETLDPAALDSQFPYDFKVRYTLDMGRLVTATAVILDPLNFGSRAWLEVDTIETSIDGEIWEEIPGLHNNTQFNILTDEANKVLNTNQTNTIMAPSKYQYSGKGVWLFGAREFKFLRMDIIQRTPVSQPYEIIEVKQARQVTKTKKALKIGPLKFGKDRKRTRTEKRWVELSYEESLQMFNGQQVLEQDFGSYRAEEGIDFSLPIIGNLFSAGATSVEKGAWQTTDVRTKVMTNAVRYAIGIRDIEILTAKYTQTSVYQSKPFRVAAPIRQLTIRADDSIPEDAVEGSDIKYYVSVDDGNTWAFIEPIDHPPRYDFGTRVPTVVQVNSATPKEAKDPKFAYLDTENPVTEVIVRIELSRPEDMVGVSPVVKRYALEILTSETKGLDI